MKKLVIRLHRIYPVLFAVAPILSLYATNAGQVDLREILVPVAVSAAVAIFMLAVLTRLFRSLDKAALFVSVAVLLCFSYGDVQDSVSRFHVATTSLGSPIVMGAVWALLLLSAAPLLARTGRNLYPLGRIFGVVSVAMVALPLLQLAVYAARSSVSVKTAICTDNEPISLDNPGGRVQRSPDIYYIILDRYPSARTLWDFYEFDNTEFVDSLKGRGFYVADRAFSNYMITAQSLASSLNFDYINCHNRTKCDSSDNWSTHFELQENYRVWRFLKGRGYRFIHFGTEWQPTSKNRFADLNYNRMVITEFSSLLLRKTVLYPVLDRLGWMNIRREKWKRINYNFDQLAAIPDLEGPKFVFAHFLLPHDPHVFDADGTFITADVAVSRSREENFVNQVRYANQRVVRLVERLLSRSSSPPVIVLQGDEGPYPAKREERDEDWRVATDAELSEKVGILNALYLPGVDTSQLYPSITPVNTFRVIFNLYFGTEYPLLHDESYAIINAKHLYSYFRITDSVR